MAAWGDLDAEVDIDESIINKFAFSFGRGMAELLKKVDPNKYKSLPSLSFPAVVGGVAGPRLGSSVPLSSVLLPVCWGAGLTARSCELQSGGGKFLRFVPDPLSRWSTAPASVDTLGTAAAIKSTSLRSTASGEPYETLVDALLPSLEQDFGIRPIHAHPFSLRQWVSLRLPSEVCFTQVMDSVAESLSANWTWSGGSVFLGPPGGCGTGCQSLADDACRMSASLLSAR